MHPNFSYADGIDRAFCVRLTDGEEQVYMVVCDGASFDIMDAAAYTHSEAIQAGIRGTKPKLAGFYGGTFNLNRWTSFDVQPLPAGWQ